MIHIGNKIREALHESRMPVKEFAIKINKSRTVVYNIFDRETIDTGLLNDIGKALNHNFFIYYAGNEYAGEMNDIDEKYAVRSDRVKNLLKEFEAYKAEIKELKEKLELTRRINALLEEKIKLLEG